MIQTKQPSETLVFAYDFSSQLATGAIAGITSATSTPKGAGANLVKVNSAFDASTVRVEWQGGVDGESYLTTVRVTDAAGQSFEIDGEIWVRETGFVVPATSASRYLSVQEYIDRYGAQETVRLTDETRSGVVDGPKVEIAINDGVDVVEGYIGTLYKVPLVNVPPIVKGMVAVLARENLHKTRPTVEVLAAADRVRSQLKDIAARRMTLPVPANTAAPLASSGLSALTSGDPRKCGVADELRDYNNLRYGDGVANWRR